jgi:3-deoxy-D-manno-octulosonic-acid transferase
MGHPEVSLQARAGVNTWRSNLKERFGLLPADLTGRLDALRRRPVWVQAVSVGEVMVARTLIAGLAGKGLPIVLSSTTPAGRTIAATLSGTAGVFHFPIDIPAFVGWTLDAIRPAAFVSIETEIWPMLLRQCARRGVPALMVNGRISERSRARYGAVAGLLRGSLAAIRLACMQTEADARRLVAIGLPEERVMVTGNMKFDGAVPAPPDGALAALVRDAAAGRPVLVAGSTSPGEEEIVLDAMGMVRADAFFLILAPRHPDRFARVAALLDKRAVPFVRRNGGRSGGTGRPRALLLDTVGELAGTYNLADVAFVGGSLVPRGGQNLTEPAVCGVPVLFGPHTQHVAAVAEALSACGGAERVKDGAALAHAIARLIDDPEARRRMGEAGRSLVIAQRGATARTVEAILPILAAERH